jgi:hypothetical protein
MINEQLFNLTYINKETKMPIKVKRVNPEEYDVIENGEVVRYSANDLRKKYKSSKKNRGVNLRGKLFIRNKFNPKKFKEYLESTSA